MNFFEAAERGLTAMATTPPSVNQGVDALYGVYFGLHAYDTHSTARALSRGAQEANPFLRKIMDVTGHPVAAMVGVKVVAAVATVGCTEVVRRKNPMAALVLMSVIDAAYAGTVLHNYTIA